MGLLPDSIQELLEQKIVEAVWRRPELSRLREPIEAALNADSFRDLIRTAFETFAAQSQMALPEFFDTGFIQMPAVLEHLSAFIVYGKSIDLEALANLYARRFLNPTQSPEITNLLRDYLHQLRETAAAHPTHGPILLARDMQAMTSALNNLRGEMHGRFDDVIARLDALLKEPEIKALVERKTGTHVFLSYSRHNLAAALKIRNALEDAGHRVWQDTTSTKGGEDWIKAIDDGVRRCYVLVNVMSTESLESYWVTEERLHARRLGKSIVPIRIDACEIPFGMLQVNAVTAFPDLNAGIADLIKSVPSAGEHTAKSDVPAPTTDPDPRRAEVDYLNRVLLEHSVWQTVYTPMAGVARIRQNPQKREIKRATAQIKPSYLPSVRDAAREVFAEQPVMKEEPFEDIVEAVKRVKHLVVLGDPGSGKTTTLWKLAADYAQAALNDPKQPIPVFVRLGGLERGKDVRAQIQAQLGGGSLDRLVGENRLALLLDGLNELPADARAAHLKEIRELVAQAQKDDMIAVVTCREIDYQGELDLGIEEKVQISPLDPVRIFQFCLHHLPEEGEALFWAMAGEAAKHYWEVWQRENKGDFAALWVSSEICGSTSGAEDRAMRDLRAAVRGETRSRLLLPLARNPYMLYMITEVYAETGTLPPNRGKLFDLFVDYLLREREHLTPEAAAQIRAALAALAYAIQEQRLGTQLERAFLLGYVPEDLLHRAISANLLEGSTKLRFTHQLLQEYFAAVHLRGQVFPESGAGLAATELWRSQNWWEPSGWEETAILLAGLYSDDASPVIRWLADANPELAQRCITESGAHIPDALMSDLQTRWLPRLTDLQREPIPAGRAAVGRGLGLLKLDSRPGVGLRADGLPDLVWCPVPAGKFIFGEGDHQRDLTLDYEYAVAKYPVTYAQYEAFVSSDGYTNKAYWTDVGWAWREEQKALHPTAYWNDPQWHIANHPVVGVTWYEAYAFCKWLNAKTGQEIRLPTEAEWEKAARGKDGLIYPYGNTFDPSNGNTSEKGIGRTSAVGMFPGGASPYGALDMSGNVWEWCQSKYASSYQFPEDNDGNGTDVRVLRGGSWNYDQDHARAVSRNCWDPSNWNFNFGFRCARS